MVETTSRFDGLLDDPIEDPVNQDPIPPVEPKEPEDEPKDPEVPDPIDEDLMSTFLKEYGIQDGKTVTYINDDGDEENVDFSTLDRTEQLNVLKELTKPELTEDEISTINYLRSNNATIQDVAEYYKQRGIEEYIAEHGELQRNYSIDGYSDDELYFTDLKKKYSEMSDEELTTELELAKTNEELYKKKVEVLRNQYKAQEDKEIEDAKLAQQEQFNTFKNNVQGSLGLFNSVSLDYTDKQSDDLLIDENEKSKVMAYVTNIDENGFSEFAKDLRDPNTLVELAWYKLFGKDAISSISQYWKSEMKKMKKEVGKITEPKVEPKVVIEPKPESKRQDKNLHTSLYEGLI